jgi:hypothetical protein
MYRFASSLAAVHPAAPVLHRRGVAWITGGPGVRTAPWRSVGVLHGIMVVAHSAPAWSVSTSPHVADHGLAAIGHCDVLHAHHGLLASVIGEVPR